MYNQSYVIKHVRVQLKSTCSPKHSPNNAITSINPNCSLTIRTIALGGNNRNLNDHVPPIPNVYRGEGG